MFSRRWFLSLLPAPMALALTKDAPTSEPDGWFEDELLLKYPDEHEMSLFKLSGGVVANVSDTAVKYMYQERRGFNFRVPTVTIQAKLIFRRQVKIKNFPLVHREERVHDVHRGDTITFQWRGDDPVLTISEV